MSAVFGLPPRTWHGWWLARPRWVRIGIWTGLVVALLQVVLALWIVVGLIESKETRELRRRGVEFRYRQLPLFEKAVSAIVRITGRPIGHHTYNVYATVSDGMLGRSPQNVELIYLTSPTDSDMERCISEFPQLKELVLRKPGRFVQADLDDLPESCQHSYGIQNCGTYELMRISFDR